CQQYNGYPPTF
nr:immunoglobulin light chain junction region [Macaca mulatta]MOV79161.1 immunoglobulin light chain junction region [Macaca mulatta]MOV79249.1 immunoglobulin light chain junction region [Macaca mulatta]MOV79834.1 immunoglobulin light chain junction region [Macaca mulatta]MOV79990.1 immunoglobulin light chain junction region [Macaca mulatta]